MVDNVNPEFLKWLEQVTQRTVKQATLIQPLWNAQGACFRATLLPPNGTSAKQNVVAKCAQPTLGSHHPKGWSGNTSFQRKCRSFKVEAYFYNHLQPFTTQECRTPKAIACHPSPSEQHHKMQDTNDTLIVMEDLATLGYEKTTMNLSPDDAVVVLNWLAAFHGQFMGVSDKNLWQEGTYWHLGTRLDEYNAMKSSPLKDAAHKLSTRLKKAKYQTVLHGDAKVANFCFTRHLSQCAAIDFQYVGHGVGVKDVAYFLGSALSESDQRAHNQDLLEVYLQALHQTLKNTDNLNQYADNEISEILDEWRSLYSFACADFHRFLAGWSPDHWKINTHLTTQTQLALNALR